MGGGGSGTNFSLTQITYAIRGGGGSNAEFIFSVTSKGNFPLMGPFFIFLLSRRGGPGRRICLFRDLKTSFFVNGALFYFFTFPKGGPGPPLNRPLRTTLNRMSRTTP